MNSKDYIKEKLQPNVEKLIEQQNCNHDFYEYGYGYTCRKCKYYTGLNHKLNDIIKKELDRVKKLERITK